MKVDRAKLAKSVFWSAVENGGLIAISLLSLIIYSRLLSAADFGLFSVVFALVELLGILTGMLFHDALVQRPDVTDLHYDTAFTFTVGSSFFLMGACWALAATFGSWVNQPAAGPILSWMSLCFPIAGISATIVARQRRVFDFRVLALRSLVGRLSGGAAGIGAAIVGAGLWSFVIQQVMSALLGSIVLWWTCNERPRLRFSLREFKQLIFFGGTSVGVLFLSFANKRVYTILLGILLGSVNAGFVNLAFRVVDMLWGIAATAIGQVALPMLSKLQSDQARLKRAYQMAVSFTCILLFPCFAGVGATAPEVIELLFGKQWLPSAPYLTVISLLIYVQAPSFFVTPLLTAVGRPRDALVGLTVQMFFMLGMMLLFGTPTISWAIGTWIGCEVIIVPVSGWMLWRAIGFTAADQFGVVLIPFTATALMLASLIASRYWFVHDLGLIARLSILMPLGVAVFCGSLFVLNRGLAIDAVNFGSSAIARKLRRL
jgi:O-antigen/teichoic acid export membrane protein